MEYDPKYRTGYKNPPRGWQFEKGRSGNPKGRPKGAKSRKAMVHRLAREEHRIDEGGTSREVSIAVLLILALRKHALRGNPKAVELWEHFSRRYQPEHSDDAGLLVVGARVAVDEWDRQANEVLLPNDFADLLGQPPRSAEPAASSPAPAGGSAVPKEASRPRGSGSGGLLR